MRIEELVAADRKGGGLRGAYPLARIGVSLFAVARIDFGAQEYEFVMNRTMADVQIRRRSYADRVGWEGRILLGGPHLLPLLLAVSFLKAVSQRLLLPVPLSF